MTPLRPVRRGRGCLWQTQEASHNTGCVSVSSVSLALKQVSLEGEIFIPYLSRLSAGILFAYPAAELPRVQNIDSARESFMRRPYIIDGPFIMPY